MAIKFGMSLAEMIAQLTRGFIKATGKQPDRLSKLKIKMEAFKRLKDQKKVVDMEGNVLDPNKPIMGGKQVEEGPINWDEVNKIDIEDFAGGGIAGMLGEPTYQDEDHRVPYGGGKFVLESLPAAIRKIMEKFGKKSITTADKIKLPPKKIQQEIMEWNQRQKKKLNTWEDPDKVRAAVDDIFPTGDYKYDASMAAEALVENNPQIFGNKLLEDLDQRTQTKIYGLVLEVVQGDMGKMLQMKRLSKPTKTLKGIEETGTINISDPKVAEEFATFMKETDPKGHAKVQKIADDINQKIELSEFDPKGKKGHADGGVAGMLGE